jgi:hypothetical protein
LRHDEESKLYHDAIKSGLIAKQSKPVQKSKSLPGVSNTFSSSNIKKGMASVKSLIPQMQGNNLAS